MSTLTFPTRPPQNGGRQPLGTPERAEHCRCDPAPWPIRDSDTCLRCGKHSRSAIDRTWQIRALMIASCGKPKAAAA